MELGIPVMLIVESYPQAGTWVIAIHESIRAGSNTVNAARLVQPVSV